MRRRSASHSTTLSISAASTPALPSSALTNSVCSRMSLISSISFLSECVLQKFEAAGAPGADYRNDIETRRPLRRVNAPQVDLSGAADPGGPARIDGLGRVAEVDGAAGLDLDEHHRLAIRRDQIDFGAGGAKIPLQYAIAAAPQMT